MNLVGLDLNGTRARAVHGSPGAPLRPLALDGMAGDLPLALSLEGRHPEVGQAGLALCRRLPHLACLNVLARLGERHQWAAGRHRLDAGAALSLVLERLQPALAGSRGLALAVPAYLTPAQIALLVPLFGKARVPVLGSVSAPLAAVRAAYREQPWSGIALVLDADDHALTLTVLGVDEEEARVLAEKAQPTLNLRAWKDCLLNAVSDRCVRHSRRDPRDSATAEQALYDQLEPALDAWRQDQMVEFVICAAPWFQNLILRAEEASAFCARLVRQTLESARALLATTLAGQPRMVVVTEATARLPGLIAALDGHFGQRHAVTDTGSLLAADEGHMARGEGTIGVVLLSGDAIACSAHELAGQLLQGDVPCTHLDTVATLPAAQPFEAGPPRLHFRGQDYLLRSRSFTLGRQPGCDLVFDSELYGTVSARHCEVVCDRQTYILRDRSRNGTLVNDRPVRQQVVLHAGDWIRLGADGPVLRFLGQVDEQHKLGTTA